MLEQELTEEQFGSVVIRDSGKFVVMSAEEYEVYFKAQHPFANEAA